MQEAASRGAPVPLVALQGEKDDVVAQVNAAQPSGSTSCSTAPAAKQVPTTSSRRPTAQSETGADGRVVTTSEWRVADHAVARHVLVGGLGHAWSGGDAAYQYNDAQAPDATALLGAFVRKPMQ